MFIFDHMSTQSEPMAPPSHACREFTLSEIQKATNNFDESLIIGEGGFGKVYKGQLSNGATVAIKRLNRSSRVGLGAPESWPERLFALHHPNLVSLIGYCNHDAKQVSIRFPWKLVSTHDKETLLVYEFMSNGSLEDHLHHLRTPLSWPLRLKICLGAARALHYLHTSITPVVHGDFKSANILLDRNWTAKLSDFGFSKIDSCTPLLTIPVGTIGYLDPYSLASRMQTAKSDVYSFGVVLLEVLCGKRAVIDKQRSLVTWVQDSVKYKRMKTLGIFGISKDDFSDLDLWDETSPKRLKDCLGTAAERDLVDIIDSDMREEISPECLNGFFAIAERCLLETPKQRPNMAEVVSNLESVFSSPLQSTPSVKEFTFNDLEIATRGFSQDLITGEGGSENVFLGWLENNKLEKGVGTAIAVKSITSEIPPIPNEWMEEVNFLGHLAHPNIISLLGCCNKSEHEHLLVYEYMKTSLSQFIHEDHGLKPLSWGTRLHIMIGVARGLTYLYTTKGLLCHFRCNDILLDEDFNAKIGGFGWVKVQERHDRMRLKGTFGYLNADYDISAGNLLMKNDTCSFGLVLLETITGRHLTNFEDVLEGLESLEMRAPKSKSNRRKVKKLMDPRLKDSYSPEGAFKCMALALRCIAIQPEYRPSREEILWSLEQIYALNK